MKTNHWILLLISSLIITGATAVIADPGGAMRHPEKPDFNPLARIDLSTEQTEKIRKLLVAHEESIAPLELQEYQTKAELDIFWLQLRPDTDKIKSAQKKLHDLRFRILEKETDFRIAVRQVLTQNQLSRLLSMGGDRRPNRDEFDHHPPHPQHNH